MRKYKNEDDYEADDSRDEEFNPDDAWDRQPGESIEDWQDRVQDWEDSIDFNND